MAKGLWLVQKKNDPKKTTVRSFWSWKEAEEWASRWMGPYTIVYFEDA